ncbi:Serine/threonine-protein kinase 33 [Sparganum proliferum]
MITEICEGGSLSSHLNSLTESDLGFKEYTVQEIVRQLTSALVYLHNRSIVHRDVKPDNVLLVHSATLERLTRPATKQDSCAFVPTPTKPPHSHKTARPDRRQHRQAPIKSHLPKMYSKSCDTTDLSTECEDSHVGGGGGRGGGRGGGGGGAVSDLKIKLVDFGMAVELEGTKDPLVGLCGTPLYMAPEVLSGRSYTRQCDVWSLGIIAYQLLCKDFPYGLQMERKSLQEEVDRRTPKLVSRAMADHVGFCARHWLLCVLQPDPVQRFSAAELLRHDWLLSAKEAGDDLGSSSLASFRGCLHSCCVSSDNTSRGYDLPIVSSNIFSFMRAYKNEHHRVQ